MSSWTELQKRGTMMERGAIAKRYLDETLKSIIVDLPRYCKEYRDFRLGLGDGSQLKSFDVSLIPEDIKYWARHFCDCDIKEASDKSATHESSPATGIRLSSKGLIGRHTTMFVSRIIKLATAMRECGFRQGLKQGVQTRYKHHLTYRMAFNLINKMFFFFDTIMQEPACEKPCDYFENLLWIMADIESIARRKGILEVTTSSLQYIHLEHGAAFWLLGTYLSMIIDGQALNRERMRRVTREIEQGLPAYQTQALRIITKFLEHFSEHGRTPVFYETVSMVLPERRRDCLLEFVNRVISI